MSTALVWFRKCLRLHDNPALWEVCQDNQIECMVPIFILDPEIVGPQFEKYGINRLRFLFENLDDLNTQIQSKSNNSLLIFWGSPQDAVQSLQSALGINLHYFLPTTVRNRMDERFLISSNKVPQSKPIFILPLTPYWIWKKPLPGQVLKIQNR
jgi:deoxyribodipyrimidine photolyase